MAITYDILASAALDNSTINFSSISSAYTDLRIMLFVKSSAGYNCGIRFNGDTGSNYTVQYSGVVNQTPNLSNSYSSNNTYWNISQAMTPSGANSFACWTFDIFNYANTGYKNSIAKQAMTDAGGGGFAVYTSSCTWRNTSAINQISIVWPGGGGPSTGSYAALYGIAKA